MIVDFVIRMSCFDVESCHCQLNKIRSQLVSMKSDMYVVLVVVLPMRLWGFGFFFSINRSLS